jgi:hypothetical protein
MKADTRALRWTIPTCCLIVLLVATSCVKGLYGHYLTVTPPTPLPTETLDPALATPTATSIFQATAQALANFTPSITPTWTPSRTPAPPATITPTPGTGTTLTPSLTPSLTLTRTPSGTLTPTAKPIDSAEEEEEEEQDQVDEDQPTPIPSRASACSGSPTGGNLLANGDFEGGWHRQTFDEINVPDGWTAFWREGGPVPHDPENPNGYGRPEMKVVPNEPPFTDPRRVYQGGRAAFLFGFWRIVDAGYYQQIQVPDGAVVCLRAFAHAWSSPHDDPRHSTLETADDKINANFLLGIDPKGGTDPFADSVRWGKTAHIYDEYAEIPSAQVTAKSSTITVFLRGYALWPFKHNDFYFDSASLHVMQP